MDREQSVAFELVVLKKDLPERQIWQDHRGRNSERFPFDNRSNGQRVEAFELVVLWKGWLDEKSSF
jgi:hypothetical protein